MAASCTTCCVSWHPRAKRLNETATRASCHSRCGAEGKRRDFSPLRSPPAAAGTSLCLGWHSLSFMACGRAQADGKILRKHHDRARAHHCRRRRSADPADEAGKKELVDD